MKHSLLRVSPRNLVVALASLALLVAFVGPSLASGSSAGASSGLPTIVIKGSTEKTLSFVGPKTVNEGEELEIVNQTDPRKVGPQTFSLVEASAIPKTKVQRESCAKKGGICKAIMGWHGVKGNGSARTVVVKAGAEGWGTEGGLMAKGDSWFSNKKGATIRLKVAAGATVAPIKLTFMSAFDPLLHGSITVLPVR